MARPIEAQIGRTAHFMSSPDIKMTIIRLFNDPASGRVEEVNLLYSDGMGIIHELNHVPADALVISK